MLTHCILGLLGRCFTIKWNSPSVLIPGFHLSLGKWQGIGDIATIGNTQIFLTTKFPLEICELRMSEGCTSATWFPAARYSTGTRARFSRSRGTWWWRVNRRWTAQSCAGTASRIYSILGIRVQSWIVLGVIYTYQPSLYYSTFLLIKSLRLSHDLSICYPYYLHLFVCHCLCLQLVNNLACSYVLIVLHRQLPYGLSQCFVFSTFALSLDLQLF